MMFGNATLRGGQTLAHDVHMWGQLVRWGLLGVVTDNRPGPFRGSLPHHDRP